MLKRYLIHVKYICVLRVKNIYTYIIGISFEIIYMHINTMLPKSYVIVHAKCKRVYIFFRRSAKYFACERLSRILLF